MKTLITLIILLITLFSCTVDYPIVPDAIDIIDTVMIDIESNVYSTVLIGNQIWTIENLRVTKFNDGTPIPYIPDSLEWASLKTPGYCYYNNQDDTTNKDKWGILYNWYAVTTGKLSPVGWTIPSNQDWDTLQDFLILNGYNWDSTFIDNKIGKSLASKTDWNYSNIIGSIGENITTNNSSGFSALPSGYRTNLGIYLNQNNSCCWWSLSDSTNYKAYNRYLYYFREHFNKSISNKKCGFSIRLIMKKIK